MMISIVNGMLCTIVFAVKAYGSWKVNDYHCSETCIHMHCASLLLHIQSKYQRWSSSIKIVNLLHFLLVLPGFC